MDQQIRTTLHRDGVLIATIDMPRRRMNVFSETLMDTLDDLMARVDADDAVRCVVLTSGKPAFLAGADLAMVCGFTDAAHTLDEEGMIALCGRLGRQFVRLEDSSKPWVAAINGIALGGGLELAMACRERIVVDDPRVQLGLPEVRWGLLPGAGGTQRLSRLAGFRPALELLLSGRSMSPQEAVRLRVVSQAVGAMELLTVARKRALDLCGRPFDAAQKFPDYAQPDVPAHTVQRALELARSFGIAEERYRDYPAYSAIINCVLLGARNPLAEASVIEIRQFIGLMANPVAGNMVRTLFLNRQRADKELAAPAGLVVERVAHGVLPPVWIEVLGKSKLPVVTDASLPDGTIELQDSQGGVYRVHAAVLGEDETATDAVAVLSPAGEYGRVIELVGTDEPARGALAALAARLYALPWPTRGSRSVLASLSRAADLDTKALAALHAFAQGEIGDPVFLDVAACAAGVSPAYSGGPFSYLWKQRERLCVQFDAEAVAAWKRLEPLLGCAYS
ncbi:MAG TPA: enoyl-CoA hydratase-related protein [Paraburkholderia sp.]